ncbi:hypothetical protein PM082_020087 [Marasmius tenuissimus]|nr:hypothetical protein PM082_020087 [Marasmius tenuissimus]
MTNPELSGLQPSLASSHLTTNHYLFNPNMSSDTDAPIPPPQYRRKMKSSPSGVLLWNAKQQRWLENQHEEFKKIIVAHDLEFKTGREEDPLAYRQWVSQAVDTALQQPEFASLDQVEHSEAEWRKSITDYFKNTRNRKIVPRYEKIAKREALARKHATRNAKLDNREPRLSVSQALQSLARFCLLTPREVFKQENSQGIKDEIDRLASPSLKNNTGLHQKAWSNMWKAVEDKTQYETRDIPPEDVYE